MSFSMKDISNLVQCLKLMMKVTPWSQYLCSILRIGLVKLGVAKLRMTY